MPRNQTHYIHIFTNASSHYEHSLCQEPVRQQMVKWSPGAGRNRTVRKETFQVGAHLAWWAWNCFELTEKKWLWLFQRAAIG
jgi:hypothetical protein